MNVNTIGKTVKSNQAVIDLFHCFSLTEDDACCKEFQDGGKWHIGLTGSTEARVSTAFTGQRVIELKTLAAHIIEQTNAYNAASRSISISDHLAGNFHTCTIRKRGISRDQIKTLRARQEFACYHRGEAFNALYVLFALLVLDFNDLSDGQKRAFLLFLISQKSQSSPNLCPMDIIETNHDYAKHYYYGDHHRVTCSRITIHDTLFLRDRKALCEKFVDQYIEIQDDTGLFPCALYAKDLKSMDLPDAYEAAWPFKELENAETPDPSVGVRNKRGFC